MFKSRRVSLAEPDIMQYSLEQLNYFRICHVGFNLVPEGLRQIFRQEWDFQYKTASGGKWQEMPHNGHDFYSKEGKKSHSKNARYLSTIKNGNTAEWDCTCLFFAILFSDSIGTTLSHAIRKDVDDLRQVRNDIAHNSEAKLTDAEFQNYLTRMMHSFTSLGLPVKDIEAVKKQTSFPTAELQKLQSDIDKFKQELASKESSLQQALNTLEIKEKEVEALAQEVESKTGPFCILTSEPSHTVVRRSNDIYRLMEKMKDLEDRSSEAVSTIYISGNPGCGKSQLARQLGEEFFFTKTRYAEDLAFVATLNAESIETLADSYITLGKHLGITEYTLTNLETSKREKPSETIQHLKRMIVPKIRKFSKWLIIADNVVELAVVRDFLPQTGSIEWGHGQVLITSQDSGKIPANASHTYHESLSRGMQVDDAVTLLKQVSEISDQSQAEIVAEVLEYQPLALAAAAYYVKTVVMNGSPNYGWTEYLEGLKQGQREATEEPLVSESSAYSKTMTTAIKMALKRADESDAALHQAFSFLSLCSSEFVPVEAVVKFVKARIVSQPKELIRTNILRSSLILSLHKEDGLPSLLRLHNAVHEVLRQGEICDLKSTEIHRNIATAIPIFQSLLDLDENENEIETYALLRKLTSHCKVLFENMTSLYSLSGSDILEKLPSFITVEEVVQWLCSTATACIELCDVSSADQVSRLACNLLKNISNTGQGNLLKANVLTVSGHVCSDIGKDLEAKELYEKALRIQKGIFGELSSYIVGGFSAYFVKMRSNQTQLYIYFPSDGLHLMVYI